METSQRGEPSGLSISVEHPDDTTAIIAPAGELDIANHGALLEVIAQVTRAELAMLVLDLRGLTFMDSSGLRVLIDTWNELKLGDRRLSIVVEPTGLVRRVLEVSGCDTILPVVETLEQAI